MKLNNKNKKIYIILVIIILLFIAITFYASDEPKIENENKNETSSTITMSNSDLAYSIKRSDYSSDEQFTNFRQIKAGKITAKIYRGASPIDNTYNRVSLTNKLLEEKEINFAINLTNSEESFKNMTNSDNYIHSLYNKNKIYFGNLGINYDTEEYASKMAKSLIEITKNDGPFYIHCTHGRDRTGMACIIIEALADASFQEILDDYMKTYENYNFVNKDTNSDMYDKIFQSRFQSAIKYITREENIDDYNSYDYKTAAINYLKYGGLTDFEINNLINTLTK